MGYETFLNAQSAALQQGRARREERERLDQRRVRQRAGNALATGDLDTASNALFQGGDLESGLAVQNAARTRQTADRDRQRSALAAAASGLLYVPEAQRAAMFQNTIAARLVAEGVPQEVVQQITPELLTDASLRAFVVQMGGDVEGNQAFNTRQGIVERDPYSGSYEMGFEVQQDPDAPTGYRWTADGSLEAIPGGPADPRVAGGLAASRRAPPRGSSGGSRRSGGGSRPAAPAAPSRKPWERF